MFRELAFLAVSLAGVSACSTAGPDAQVVQSIEPAGGTSAARFDADAVAPLAPVWTEQGALFDCAPPRCTTQASGLYQVAAVTPEIDAAMKSSQHAGYAAIARELDQTFAMSMDPSAATAPAPASYAGVSGMEQEIATGRDDAAAAHRIILVSGGDIHVIMAMAQDKPTATLLARRLASAWRP